jgi:flagellar hook assembly protein FlgD
VYLQKIDKSGNLGVVVSVNDQKEKKTPVNFHLYQNHPNPVLNETVIQYSLASGPLLVSLKIYNLFGEEVVTLVHQIQAPGHHTVRWSGVNQNGLPVAAGIYFYKLQIGQDHWLKKLVVIR